MKQDSRKDRLQHDAGNNQPPVNFRPVRTDRPRHRQHHENTEKADQIQMAHKGSFYRCTVEVVYLYIRPSLEQNPPKQRRKTSFLPRAQASPARDALKPWNWSLWLPASNQTQVFHWHVARETYSVMCTPQFLFPTSFAKSPFPSGVSSN